MEVCGLMSNSWVPEKQQTIQYGSMWLDVPNSWVPEQQQIIQYRGIWLDFKQLLLCAGHRLDMGYPAIQWEKSPVSGKLGKRFKSPITL